MSKDTHLWSLEQHCCRVCFGRIVSREIDEDGKRLYQCSNCGLSAKGHKASVLCACGTKLNRGSGKLVDAGLRCHPNKAISPAFPSLIVCSHGGAQPEL